MNLRYNVTRECTSRRVVGPSLSTEDVGSHMAWEVDRIFFGICVEVKINRGLEEKMNFDI